MARKDPNVMNVHEAAAFFGVAPYTIREWLKNGRLKGTKPGKAWRIELADARHLAQGIYGSD